MTHCTRPITFGQLFARRTRECKNSTTGAWGESPFENDDAADFSATLREAAIADALGETCATAFHSVLSASYVEIGVAAEAVAAAVVVAVAAGADPELLSTPYSPGLHASDLLAQLPPDRFAPLEALASATLDRVVDEESDNEWVEAWQDSGLLDEVIAALQPVRQALR